MLESEHVKLRIGGKVPSGRQDSLEYSWREVAEVKNFPRGEVPEPYSCFWQKTASLGQAGFVSRLNTHLQVGPLKSTRKLKCNKRKLSWNAKQTFPSKSFCT